MASAIDVLTLAEAKAALNITGSTFDAELAGWNTGVAQQLDKLCGPIVQRATSESHDGGCQAIYLRSRPVASITSVVEYAGTAAATLTAESPGTAGTYLLEAAAGVLRRRSGLNDAWFASGRGNVTVAYVAGRFDSVSTVDEKFKSAARVTLTNLWRREQGGGTETFGGLVGVGVVPGFGLPNAALDILADEILAPEQG